MTRTSRQIVISDEMIRERIYLIRGKKVMLDQDLARLYEVENKYLLQQVRRNIKRFPQDFMFQLTINESLRLQNATSKIGRGGRRYSPCVFTEQGIAMLSSVLNSERAIQVNIQIMRAFTKIREMLQAHKELWAKIEQMEKKYDKQFKVVFDALRQLLNPPMKAKRKVGFQPA